MSTTANNKAKSNLGYIELSPSKGKKPHQQTEHGYSYKENRSVNFQIVNIPIRTEKPFSKIPKFNETEIVVKSNIKGQSELQKSRKKKITVTKLIYDADKMVNNSISNRKKSTEGIGQEKF